MAPSLQYEQKIATVKQEKDDVMEERKKLDTLREMEDIVAVLR